MTPYYEEAGIKIYHGDCREMFGLITFDHIITDPPYSERTHAGHDASANGHMGRGKDSASRSELGYGFLSTSDVVDYLTVANGTCKGWIVTMTDHTLAPVMCDFFASHRRYCFAPLPFFSPGRSVRLSGDGPCSWTDWIVVSRTAAQSKWGTLPGGYVFTSDRGYMGGKPLDLMLALVRDYSRDGETVLDPYMGSGTTLEACKKMGRKAVGIDISERACEIAANRLRQSVFQFEEAV